MKYITYKGEKHTYTEWEKILGLKPCTISNRLRYGWTELQALGVEPPPDNPHSHSAFIMIYHNGETRTVPEWSRITGININTMYGRVSRGLKAGEVLTPGKLPRRGKASYEGGD